MYIYYIYIYIYVYIYIYNIYIYTHRCRQADIHKYILFTYIDIKREGDR